ncbi:hypothetical protein THRCLA_22815 [Thraustotheca clavata]|uniref:Restriction endonuclease domain-containing protein n=1 Tax=Thraustotheca clavata TaxID=74557 RepID=A0A1V9YS80_9STRA|nr:hypothetical protein THRCLA_22815 [Thraustotheca clavata]
MNATSPRSLPIQASDVYRVIEQLQCLSSSMAPDFDEDGDANWGPVVLCPRLSLDDFIKCLPILEDWSLSCWEYLPSNQSTNEGSVVINRLPSKVHECTACSIEYTIIKQIKDAVRQSNNLTIEFHSPPYPICRIGNILQAPTQALIPDTLSLNNSSVIDAGFGSPFPAIVIEISYKNEKLATLRSKLERWMSMQTSVQIAIGIKIFAISSRRVAILHRRGYCSQEIDFGDNNQWDLVLTFPLGAVFTGVDPLPHQLFDLQNIPIVINLVCLREQIDLRIARDN